MDDVTLALRTLAGRQHDYATYEAYYAGRQRLTFASDSFRQAFAGQLRQLVYNRCGAVVDALADRLRIEGWQANDSDQVEPVEQAALEVWRRSRLDLRHVDAHVEAMRSGDAYLIVWPDMDGAPRIAVNAGHLVTTVRDDEDPERIVLAVKAWQVTRGPLAGRWRVTTYAPDAIRRWITTSAQDAMPEKSAKLEPYEDEAPAEVGNPWGVTPVFGLHNASGLGAAGVSELRDLIPLQDGLNKSIADMLVAMEYVAYPQRWATGVEVPLDPETGRPMKPFRPGVDRVWVVGDENATLGEFPPADMGGFLSVQQDWDVKISRVSRVPVHWLGMSGGFPSGESLKTAEAPFVSKVLDRQAEFGAVWGDAMALALRIAGFSEAEAGQIAPVWVTAETRSESEFWRVAQQKQAAGVPSAQIWREAGYTPGQVEEFAAAQAVQFDGALQV